MGPKAVYIARRVASQDVSHWLEDHAVMVEAGRISGVLPRGGLPSDISETHEVHDLGDVSLLPGLVEGHTHMHVSSGPAAQMEAMSEGTERLIMRSVNAVRTVLLSGVTTMRDLGSPNNVAFPVRQAVRDGVIPGPRMLLAGAPITTTAGHCWFFGAEADSTEEVVKAVRPQVKLGADFIKIMSTGGMFTPTSNPRSPQYPVETLRAAVAEAEQLNVQVASHCLSAQGVRNCVEAGVHTLIHARWYDADFTKGLAYDTEVADLAAEKGIRVDPTTGHQMLGKLAVEAGESDPPNIHWAVSGRFVPNEEHEAVLRDMRERGVRYVTGLDMGMRHGAFDKSAANAWSYVELLGLSPWEAIAVSTIGSAEALRVDRETGSLEPGKSADMMAVRGDPARDITALFDVADVVYAGRPVRRGGVALV
ncbi:MAG: amidohydrolase family protein [Chloroflexota bacterium]